jgi:hypothetical protein
MPTFTGNPDFMIIIINDLDEYMAIRDYIVANPVNWGKDDLHNC